MKKETQIKIVEGAINGVVNALFGKLNDGPNFDLLENYKTENFFKGTEEFLEKPSENAVWQLGYSCVDLTPKDYKDYIVTMTHCSREQQDYSFYLRFYRTSFHILQNSHIITHCFRIGNHNTVF